MQMDFDVNKIIKVALTEQIGAVFVNIIAIFRHRHLVNIRWFWPTQHSSLIYNTCSWNKCQVA